MKKLLYITILVMSIKLTPLEANVQALYDACKNGDVAQVETHLNHADELFRTFCRTPLCLASFYGHTEIVNALIQANADVNKARNNGVTPLYIASQNGHPEIVHTLIEEGADINARSNINYSPFQALALRESQSVDDRYKKNKTSSIPDQKKSRSHYARFNRDLYSRLFYRDLSRHY